MNPIFFCNIGWMLEYNGITKTDVIVNGGAHIKLEKSGGEVCNFVKHRGYCYGYVQPSGGHTIHIQRMGADKEAESISPIDVVFVARRPGLGRVIVGWYKNATVFRFFQPLSKKTALHRANRVNGYRLVARPRDVRLLEPDERFFRIPDGRHQGMPQSNIWYADNADPKWLAQVRAYISGKTVGGATSKKKSAKAPPDQDHKLRVEKAAIDAVRELYRSKGFEVRSVESEKVGWDIEAWKENAYQRLEVKGTAGKEVVAQLTPNEYSAMKKHKDTYAVCIVTSALSSSTLRVFSYNYALQAWAYLTGKKHQILRIKLRTGAAVSCV